MTTYSDLFEGLSSANKIELIERLSKSLKIKESKKESRFYNPFGTFGPEKSAEEIIADIKSSRKFRKREFKLWYAICLIPTFVFSSYGEN